MVPAAEVGGGLAATADGRSVFYSQVDSRRFNIMIARDFR
jgi:hypothetical protein